MIPLSTKFVSKALTAAILEAAQRQILQKGVFDNLEDQSRLTAFTVAGDLTNRSILSIQKKTNSAIEAGMSFADYKKTLTNKVLSNIVAPKVVWRNAINNSYQNARFQQQNQLKSIRPFLRYKTFGDEQVRPNHAAMNGIVARQGDPFWQKNYPPNGHQCRCVAVTIKARQVQQQGLKVETDKQATRRVISEQKQNGIPNSKIVIPVADKGWRNSFQPNETPEIGLIKDLGKFNKKTNTSLLTVSDGLLNFQEITIGERMKKDIQSLNAALPELKKDSSNYVTIKNIGEFKDLDYYINYSRKRLFGSRELTKRVNVAAEIIRKPVSVFRDFYKKNNSDETTYTEEYIGLKKAKSGQTELVSVLTHRNVIIKVTILGQEKEGKILDAISGVNVFNRY